MSMENITAYLSNCRWCNFKEEITNKRVSSVKLHKLPFDNNTKLFIIGKAVFINGETRYFSMPLAKVENTRQEELNQTELNQTLLLNGNLYTDALLKPDFFKSLMTLMEENNGSVLFPNGWRLERAAFGNQQPVEQAKNETSSALGVEQSNTTLNVGNGKLAFKLERMLEFSQEVNSEFEVNEKLMRENCSVMPKSFGGFIWRMPDGRQASSGIIQEFVNNKGDMWNYLLNILDKELTINYLRQRDLSAESTPEFMSLIRNLSLKTEEMGTCFAKSDENPNFTPEKVDESFLRKYEKQFEVLLYQTRRHIEENLTRLPEPTRTEAQNLLQNWDKTMPAFIKKRLDQIRSASDKGTINRVHGDFHLGQVMVTPENDLRFIDFAGEPALPMKERKQKHIHIRDTAGMYRSIKGYLGAVAVENFAAKAQDEVSAARRKQWASQAIKPLINRASQTFLGQKTMNDPCLSLEVLRKNLYEVNYELSSRAKDNKFVCVPINGLSELMSLNPPTPANENHLLIGKTQTGRQ